MNVWELYQFNGVRSNKEQSGQTFTVEQFNLGLKGIDLEFLKLKYGLPEEYRPGVPIPRQAWAVTQKIMDDLRALKVVMGGRDHPLLPIDKYGFAVLPSDYIHYSSLRYDITTNAPECGVTGDKRYTPIEVLTDEDFDARLWSVIKRNWMKYPFCRFNNNHIEFKPENMQFAVFSYIRMPKPAYLAVTLDNNNDYVYDPANSIQLEWPQDMHMDIANILYQLLSQNLSNSEMNQNAQIRKVQGI